MKPSDIKLIVNAFMAETVRHRFQEEAHEAVSFACNDDPSASIVVLAGPTGVGKSTLLSKLSEEFLRQNAPGMAANALFRPVVYTVAVASGHRGFDWKRLFKDASTNLDDPFAYQRNRRGPRRASPTNETSGATWADGIGAALMRQELEAELQLRGSLLWIIDEAQHVIRGGRTGGPGDQLDVLKSLSQTARTKLLLCGTYDLPDYLSGSGQLSRRSSVVRLNRYRWSVPEERFVFANVVNALFKRLPDRAPHPDVKANLKFFYIYSLGCVGIFKEWAARALSKQLRSGDAALTVEHFRLTRMAANELAVINQEVLDGESRYGHDVEEAGNELVQSILHGVPALKPPSPRAPKAARAARPASRQPSPRRVGERTPGRDRVGSPS